MGKVSYKCGRWRPKETAIEARLRLLQGLLNPTPPDCTHHTSPKKKRIKRSANEILAACDDNQVPTFTTDPSLIQRKPYELPLQDERNWCDLRDKKGTHGRFTKAEDQLIRTQLQKLFEVEGVSWKQGMDSLIWRKDKKRDEGGSPWKRIANPLPDRHIESVVQYVQSQIYEWPRRGAWSEEEDMMLVSLVAELGTAWKEISRRMGRFWKSCNDHYRDLKSRNRIDELLEKSRAPVVIEVENEEKEGKGVSVGGEGDDTISTRDTPVGLSSQSGDRFRLKGGEEKQIYRRRLWDDAEDERLLAEIREVTKVEFPISRVPWTYIGVKMSSGEKEKGRTKSDLRKRYVTYLLPLRCSRQISEFQASCRREIFRYILQAVQTNPEVEWDELMFNKIIPFWTPDRINYIAGRCIQRFIMSQRIDSSDGLFCSGRILTRKMIMESSHWKTILPDLCRAMGITKYKQQDHQVISDYLNAIAQANGGAASLIPSRTGTIKLPIDTDQNLMKNFTRRKLRDLYAYETQQATASLELQATQRAMQQPSTSFLDHALDLLIEGADLTPQPSNQQQENGQSAHLSPTIPASPLKIGGP